MNEEIKLSWKGKVYLSSSELFVGRVLSKKNENNEITVILEGKDLKKNESIHTPWKIKNCSSNRGNYLYSAILNCNAIKIFGRN